MGNYTRPSSVLVFQSSLLAKWLRERVRVRVRPRARECITFFPLVLQYVGKIVVFVVWYPLMNN